MTARFAVGIDLGTTNTVVASAAYLEAAPASVFRVRQLVSGAEVQALPLFPSTLYAPLAAEGVEDPFEEAPWALGEIARRRGAEVPGRAVASSKSWLAHAGVDRTAAILPWGAPEEVPRLSPVEAATRLLAHVRRQWDEAHPEAPLADQDVVLTVPASFDEVARELSIEAASRAGLAPKLLEEPQAAFYDWMARAGASRLAEIVGAREGVPERGAFVLVVDVGGGTTDLSLVRVEGPDRVSRVAVGPHLLLGGDNMDLALAHMCEPRLVGAEGRLDAGRFGQLVVACRGAKESLLGADPPESAAVTVLGGGASLVGAARTTRVTRDEVRALVLDGFFPVVESGARPQRARSALVGFGLPYERDVAVTRHVAAFLARHLPEGRWPDALLLNGGVFRASSIAERLLETLVRWRGGEVLRLPDADPDLAVARGAVAYARARAGRGVRIGGGSSRGYFVGIADEGARPRAVCVVPRGAEEGIPQIARGRTFALSVGRPARFELLASDEVDALPGDVVDVDADRFARLPPVAATLEASERSELAVSIEGELTPVGTVDLACVEAGAAGTPRRFRLAFQLRGSGAPAPAPGTSTAPPPSRRIDPAVDLLDRVFGKARADASPRAAKDLLRDLERALGDRGKWTSETNRRLFDALVPMARGRRRTADHERMFWLLAGWSIRPGFGDPLDPPRVAALAPLFDEKLAFPAEARGWQQFWIAWRRAAGGLDEPTQGKIRDLVDAHLSPAEAGRRPKKPALSLDDALETASLLERVPPARRAALGEWVIERTWTDRDPRLWAAIGRLGARVPSYASVHHVVEPRVAKRWLEHLLREKWDAVPTAQHAAVQLARRTGDRARDIGERVRREVAERLVASGADAEAVRAVREVVAVEETDRAAFFGDALPLGLRLVT